MPLEDADDPLENDSTKQNVEHSELYDSQESESNVGLESPEYEILIDPIEHKEEDQQTFSLVEYDFFSKIKERTLSWFGANSEEEVNDTIVDKVTEEVQVIGKKRVNLSDAFKELIDTNEGQVTSAVESDILQEEEII